ncbi:sorting nexin-14-like isoform X1, partial [Leptotrombidium deliense]
ELVDLSLFKICVEQFGRDLFLIRVEDQLDKWKVLRSKRDFSVLDEKLRRFHGNNLFEKKPKKDDSVDEIELELFLSELISIPKLKCSQLLNNFLKDEEFETKNDLIFNDLINSFRKLIPENRKLDTFIHSFILSTMERKERSEDDIEEAEEVHEEKSFDELRFTPVIDEETYKEVESRTLVKLRSVE